MRGWMLVALSCLLGGCGPAPPHVTVASKNFAEQLVLGEIIAQQLERRGMNVERKLNLGGTLVAHNALTSGAIDLYPEYTGTALMAVLKLPAGHDPKAVFDEVAKEYEGNWQLRWLPPLGFNNTFAMTVRGETARAGGFKSISDAARRPPPWKLGVGYEFMQRSDGYAGLRSTYQLKVDGDPVTMDLGLLYQSLMAKQVDMVAASATDGQLSALDVKVLEDDRHYFPPYQCAVVVREAALAREPRLGPALKELSGKFDDVTMRRLNHAADTKHRPIADIAAEYLRSY
jgi:osmoprotectant transport system substrate-binding protein